MFNPEKTERSLLVAVLMLALASFAAWPVVAALAMHHKSRAESGSARREGQVGQARPAGSRSTKLAA